ncbi:MAG: fatty acid desaturase [Chthoniobacterales bacterium]|nr:fatty acid desaturase [Chthoniobacterales bacterium]
MQIPLISRIPWERVNWTTSIFLAVINTLAVTAVPLYIWKYGLDWFQVSLFLSMVILTGLSITLGYHRLFSHLSFKARAPVKLVTLLFGACAFENSVLDWCSDHRKHHKHVDHEDDPYDITKGFLWAHIGWLLFKISPELPMDNVNDLRKDRLVMWQRKWCIPIAFILGFGVPTALGFCWGGWNAALGAFLLAGVLRVFTVQHSTFFINSLCHTLGNQPYSTRCSARDSALMAFFTFGEGYHNYHHEFQHDYRNGVKSTNFDPTKWSIWTLEKLGLVSDLRRVPDERILLAEMNETKRRAERQLQQHESIAAVLGHQMHDMFDHLSARLTANYEALEKATAESVEVSRQAIENWRRETREFAALLSDLDRRLPSPA